MKTGEKAIVAADFPLEFAAAAAQKSFALQSCLSIRAGQPPNTNKVYDVAPKPMAIKTKTCSSSQGLAMVAGFIPVDQQTFGRANSKALPIDCESSTLKMTLNELLVDAGRGKYELTAFQGGYLEFKSIERDSTSYDDQRVNKNEITFRLKLEGGGDVAERDLQMAGNVRPWHGQSAINSSEFWSEALNNFNPAAVYNIQYKLPGDHQFNNLDVASINGKPVTGDADILSVAVPLAMERRGHGTVYNASKPTDLKELVKDFILLLHEVSGEKLTFDQMCEVQENVTRFAQTSGIISSYQLLTAMAVNDGFSSSASIFNALFQHGPETNNPGDPSDLNGGMLHFYKGLPVLTETENELVAFVMQPGFLEEHFYPVHPGWNMEKWSPVIDKQLELGQLDLIHPKTLEAYDHFKKEMSMLAAMAPEIDRRIKNGEIANIDPVALEGYDKYMKYSDGAAKLDRDIVAMGNAMQDGGVLAIQYAPNKKEFSVAATPTSAAVAPAAEAVVEAAVEHESTIRMRH